MKTSLLVLFAVLLFVPACKEESQPAAPVELSQEDLVRQNCLTVKAAADAFAAQNVSYPEDVEDLQPFLPSGELLENPFTSLVTEPFDGTAVAPGHTGYLPYPSATGVVGYLITGFGEFNQIFSITFDSRNPTLNDLVIQNCHIVADACEAFATQNGRYPGGMLEIVPFLPNGERLVNPYHGARTEPKDGGAVSPGETGYEAISNDVTVVAYNISGFGQFEVIYMLTSE